MNSREKHSPSRPLIVRTINRIGPLMQSVGVGRIDFSPEGIKRDARRKAQLSDFGDGDFEPGLEKLLQSMLGDAKLNYLGKLVLRMMMRNRLVTRLRMTAALNDHPVLTENRLQQPLFVIGHPRTGTTLLYNLLALDQTARAPLLWELLNPAPPERLLTAGEIEQRIAAAEKAIVRPMMTLAKGFDKVHWFGSATVPEEDYYLLEPAFHSVSFGLRCDIPEYLEWLARRPQAEMVTAYRYYSQLANILMYHHHGKRWLAKSPLHAAYLPALMEAIPDALIVHTHRDPSNAVPSTCSLFRMGHSLSSDYVNPQRIGEIVLRYRELAQKGIDDARRARPDQVVDVDYKTLVAKPIETVADIYSQFQLSLRQDHESAMREWVERRNPYDPKRRGKHVYQAGDYGLSEEQLQRMAP